MFVSTRLNGKTSRPKRKPVFSAAHRMAEFKRWCPSMRCVRLHVNDEEERRRLRKEVLADPGSFDVAVTTYDMVHSAHFGDALRSNIVWRWVHQVEGRRRLGSTV